MQSITRTHFHNQQKVINRSALVRLDVQGDYFGVKVSSPYPNRQPAQPALRGAITEFSRKSRKRLMDLFARLDRDAIANGQHLPKFITLTYARNMTDARRAKRDLDVFLKRLMRRSGSAWVVWKLEQQKRGSIHFHLIAGNVPYWPAEALQAAWGEITGEDKPFTRIEAIRTARGLMAYVSKYLGKMPDDDDATQHEAPGDALGSTMRHISPQTPELESPGRFWGVYGRENMPFAKRKRFEMVLNGDVLAEWVNGIDSPFAVAGESFTLYTANGTAILSRLFDIGRARLRKQSETLERVRRNRRIFWQDEYDDAREQVGIRPQIAQTIAALTARRLDLLSDQPDY